MRKMRKLILSAVVCSGVAAVGAPARAAVLPGVASDNELNADGSAGTVTGQTARAGFSSTFGNGRNAIFPFQLPNFGTTATPFTSASLTLTVNSISGPGAFTFNGDLYGLPANASSAIPTGTGNYYQGQPVGGLNDGNPAHPLIQDNFVTTAATGGTVVTTDATGSASLVNYLNTQYAGGLGAGQYVFLRAVPDTTTVTQFTGYNFATADSTVVATRPALTYTAVPEPSAAVGVAGIAAVAGLLRRRRSVVA
jgi:hypothetical protein